MSLIIELKECWTIWVIILEVKVVDLRLICSVAALFTDVHLCATFLVSILMLHTMYFQTMGLQRTALSKRFFTQVAFVGPDARVRSRVPLQIEGVIEALAAEGAEVPLHVAVTLHVAVEQPLQREALGAEVT